MPVHSVPAIHDKDIPRDAVQRMFLLHQEHIINTVAMFMFNAAWFGSKHDHFNASASQEVAESLMSFLATAIQGLADTPAEAEDDIALAQADMSLFYLQMADAVTKKEQ